MSLVRTAKEQAYDEGLAFGWKSASGLIQTHRDMQEKATKRAAELEAENARLRHLAQSRYELLRECQTEFKAFGFKGLVETIEAALTRSDPA